MLGASFFRRLSDKFEPLSQKTAAKELHQHYRGWQIEVTEKRVGVTVPRRTFSAAMRQKRSNAREFFAGFTSQQAALDAAHERIDELAPTRSKASSRDKVCGPLSQRKSS